MKNDAGRTIGTAETTLDSNRFGLSKSGGLSTPESSKSTVAFRGVKADDITDTMSVSVSSVNGINADQAANRGYISISTYADSIGRVADLGSKGMTADYDYEIKNNAVTITKYRGGSKDIAIPERMEWSVISIGDRIVSGSQLNGVTTLYSVTSIGDGAFCNNQLTSVTIGANVTLSRYGSSCDDVFDRFYNQNGKKAGTYTYNPSGSKWSFWGR